MKQKNQLILLGVLVVVMAVVWYLNRSKPEVVAGNATAFQNYQLLAVENPQLHREKMEAAQKAEYHSTGRNPFSEIAPPPPQEAAKKVATHLTYGPIPLPPPPPPTLPGNMKFFGYGTVPNGTSRRAFLTDGDDVYIVAEGDTFLGRFRIVKVNNANLEFEDIATGRRNTVALTQEDVPAPPSS
ncbi:MAG TPA: hypothetical protein VGH83_10425 [Candidatus Acidoferrum sp.]|jgi:hypothetical protein